MRKIHGFDIDGTVTTQDTLIECLAKEFNGFNLTQLTDYKLNETLFKHGYIKDVNDFDVKGFFMHYIDEIYANSKLSDGFLDYLSTLGSDKVHFITAREPEHEEFTKRLFDKYGLPYENVIHVGSDMKDQVVEGLGLDYFYDDHPDTALRIANKDIVKGKIILPNYPYNNKESLQNHSKIITINNWNDLYLFNK